MLPFLLYFAVPKDSFQVLHSSAHCWSPYRTWVSKPTSIHSLGLVWLVWAPSGARLAAADGSTTCVAILQFLGVLLYFKVSITVCTILSGKLFTRMAQHSTKHLSILLRKGGGALAIKGFLWIILNWHDSPLTEVRGDSQTSLFNTC